MSLNIHEQIEQTEQADEKFDCILKYVQACVDAFIENATTFNQNGLTRDDSSKFLSYMANLLVEGSKYAEKMRKEINNANR